MVKRFSGKLMKTLRGKLVFSIFQMSSFSQVFALLLTIGTHEEFRVWEGETPRKEPREVGKK